MTTARRRWRGTTCTSAWTRSSACSPAVLLEIVDGAGHWVMYERPDLFNPLLLEILDR